MTRSRMVHQTEATRQKIIAAAEPMFVAKGFADTQMKDIATAIDMSRNTLYRYYQDKFELGFAILVKVLQRQTERTQQSLQDIYQRQQANVLDQLQSLYGALCDETTQQDARFMAEFDAYYSGDRLPDNFRETLRQAIPDGLPEKLFDDLIARGQEQGDIRHDLTPRQIAVILINAIPVFHRRMLLRQNALVEVEPEAIPALTPALIQILIDGLRPTHSHEKETQ